MAKMKTPKKKEVIKYFENAKEVECLTDKETYDISKYEFTISKFQDDWWLDTPKDCATNIHLFDDEKGYAKILSYKEPKEEAFTITKEQILNLEKSTHSISGQFVRDELKELFPSVFETELVVGKWYFRYGKKELAVWNDGKKTYGFRYDGLYLDRFSFTDTMDVEEATHQEVTEALTKECERLGIKEGVYIEKVVAEYNIGTIKKGYDRLQVSDELFEYDSELNYAYIGNLIVFNNGVFAKPMPTLTIQEAEAKLKEIGVNAKIV